MVTKTVITGNKVQCIEENVVGELSIEQFLEKIANLPYTLNCGWSDGFIKHIAFNEGMFNVVLWYPWSLKSLPVALLVEDGNQTRHVTQVPLFIPAHAFFFTLFNSDAGFRLRATRYFSTDNIGRHLLRLPFPNVNNNGLICMGTSAVPANPKMDGLMNDFVTQFWTSPMNADMMEGNWSLDSIIFKRELSRITGPSDGCVNDVEKRLRITASNIRMYMVHASSYILGQMVQKDEKYAMLVNGHAGARVNEAVDTIFQNMRDMRAQR